MKIRVTAYICRLIWLHILLLAGGSQGQSLTPNPAAAGLWVGEVTLQQVTHARGRTNAPAADQAQLRIILHVTASGAVYLLKDVTIAQKTPEPGSPPSILFVTDPASLPGLSGVVTRGGKLVGRRLATAAYDFAGNELPMTGGLGENFQCEGRITLAADHPTNPFRHKYHPDHATGFEITRSLGLRFTQPMLNVNGVDQLTGEYEETLVGLHKSPLTTKGTVVLSRIGAEEMVPQ